MWLIICAQVWLVWHTWDCSGTVQCIRQVERLHSLARRSLATCQIISGDYQPDDLPGGIWLHNATLDVCCFVCASTSCVNLFLLQWAKCKIELLNYSFVCSKHWLLLTLLPANILWQSLKNCNTLSTRWSQNFAEQLPSISNTSDDWLCRGLCCKNSVIKMDVFFYEYFKVFAYFKFVMKMMQASNATIYR